MAAMKLSLRAPHTVYKNAAGKRVPGVTTILGVLAKPQLLGWYARTEREAILDLMGDDSWTAGNLEPCLPRTDEGDPRPFADIRKEKAADLGTIVHARIEAWLTGQELEPDGLDPEQFRESVHGFDRFRRWFDGKGFTLVASELQMVSEAMQVGGTMDVAVKDKTAEGICVVDIKSSKASKWWPYKEHKAQPQTYGRIWSEINGEAPVHEVWVYRCGTTPKDLGQEYQLTEKERAAGNRLFGGALACYLAARDLE